MRTFFIAGAPRSGTGFLSAFLTSELSVCFHEGIKFAGRDYKGLFERSRKPICGDSGAHIAFIYPALKRMFPDAKFVIIKRDRAKCIERGMKIGMQQSDIEAACDALQEMEEDQPHPTLEFSNIFLPASGEAIWNHCIGTPFDGVRFEVLRRLNIQATDETHEETKSFVANLVAVPINLG